MGLFDNWAAFSGARSARSKRRLACPHLSRTGQNQSRRHAGPREPIAAKRAAKRGSVVARWNRKIPITADQLRAALGNEQVQQLAQHFGIPIDGVLNLLAQHLPNAIDQASQQGTVQPSS